MDAGIAGASGYAGAELLRLLAGHPELVVRVAAGDSHAGETVASLYPSLAAAHEDLRFSELSPSAFDGLDVAFLSMPHGEAQALVPEIRSRVGHIVDLSADFRLKDSTAYPRWYGSAHLCPELLCEFACGIPELFRGEVEGARLVAAAGCYVTAAALALAPFTRSRLVQSTGIIVDAATGISGAGRAFQPRSQFAAANEDFSAYSLLDHRHTPEMEQAIGAEVLFTPHLAPMTRGILATCYARPSQAMTTAEALDVLAAAYGKEPFVQVSEALPGTKETLGSNCARLTARVDGRTGWLVVLAAIDNLVKGASGQALQCANLALGLAETDGLPVVGLYP